MRIVSITAGAADMYCGSCLRDNALAAALMDRGHDVLLVPLYTPTLTDEPNVAQPQVFFGGVSVYLQQKFSLFRKTPWLLDRLWDSRLLLKAASRGSISTDPRLLGDLTVSVLKGEGGNQRKEVAKLLNWLAYQPKPDVVSLPNSLLSGLAAPLRKALRCPVACTLQGEDLFLEGLPEPYRKTSLELIRQNARDVDAFVAVSRFYAGFMADYLGIPQERIEVVPLGINLDGYAEAPRKANSVFTVGYFARVAPEKGLHVLCEAYRWLRKETDFQASRLEAAGYLGSEHKPYLEEIRKEMRASGLEDEFHYRGVLDRRKKIEFLSGLDVFSVPPTYDEPKGMFLLEALAEGVPAVAPRRGALVEILERTGGGILVEPGNPRALGEAILALRKDPARARELGEKGADGVRRHYSVDRMADRALELFAALAGPAGSRVQMGAGNGTSGRITEGPLPALEVKGLSKEYPTPRGPLSVLDGVTLSLAWGDSLAVMGPSGSGKSTLLYILGGLEPPTQGTVILEGENPYQLPEQELAAFRNRKIGFVFQDHCLLPQCSVLENVLTPTLVSDASNGSCLERAQELLEQVGLKERLEHRPAELSGGEKQRVALARALIRDPVLLLCDEPTGNLDRRSAEGVAELLRELHGRKNNILMVVTHSLELAGTFPRRLELVDRHLEEA